MRTVARTGVLAFVSLIAGALLSGCGKDSSAPLKTGMYVDKAPHGGTPVVLGDGDYHVEFVREAETGTLSAYVLDDEMEDFIRSSSPSITIIASIGGEKRTLVLEAVPNTATGETVGNTSLFEAQADWLKTTGNFDAVLHGISINGTAFADTPFNFPAGNEKD